MTTPSAVGEKLHSQFGHNYIPRLPRILPHCLTASSPLHISNQKRKKTAPQEGSLRMHHNTLAPLRFSGGIPSEHKHTEFIIFGT